MTCSSTSCASASSLTGTNVGCDTSSCGACTVLLDGESVKSCTVLGVQADGAADHDDRGPCLERRAASRPAGLPRPPRAPVRLLHAGHGDGRRLADRERRGDRPRRDPARASKATSAAAPATTTSSRRSPPPPGARHERHRDAAHRRRAEAQGGRSAPPRPRDATSTTSTCPGTVVMAVVRSPYAHAQDQLDRHGGREGGRGRRRRLHRRRPARRLEGGDAVRLAGDRGHEEPRALPARRRRGALPGRRRRGRDRRHARARGRCGGARRRRLRAARRARRRRGGGAGRRGARARGARHERLVRLEARDGHVRRRRRRDRQAPLRPAAADPERDRAARRRRAAGARRRRHALVGDAGAAHPAAAHRGHARDVRDEAARDRAGRRRRLRLEARRLRRGAARRRARAPPRHAREVDRGALGERARDDPRPRLRDDARARGDEGRQDHLDPGERDRLDGGVPAARHARHPAARRLDLRRPVRDPELQRHVHRRVHEHDADRRLPRRRPARGDLRARADDGPAREGARDRPGRAAAQELHHGVPGHARLGADDRQRRLPRLARQAARAPRPRRARGRAAGAARPRRREADRRRLLDLQRDVRPRAVADPRRDPLRGGRLGDGDDPLPADRHVPGRHRHLAARPGPRDGVVADRGRPARLRPVRGRGAARRHEHLAVRPRHVREPEPPGRRRGALDGGREDHREGARDRRAPARGLGRRPRLRRPAPSR